MATHSSVLAWRVSGMAEPGGAAVYGVAQSQTQLKRFSSSSSSIWGPGPCPSQYCKKQEGKVERPEP